MSSAAPGGLESVVRSLSTLISGKLRSQIDYRRGLEHMRVYMEAVGVNVANLPAIHVAGTKGKGSTCAFAERILRDKGLRTGLYTSPHLIDVRERIRVNGRVLPEDTFCRHFWHCWDTLSKVSSTSNGEFASPASSPGMPSYFRFLTCLAFYIFQSEKVDVAIVEVGVGGRYDATNILPHPMVCGISSIGFDHMAILGDTLAKIAYEKSGIIKKDIPVISAPQKEEAATVISSVAKEVGAPLYIAKKVPLRLKLGIAGDCQRENAALAASLCSEFLSRRGSTQEEQRISAWEEFTRRTGASSTSESSVPSYPLNLRRPEEGSLANTFWPARSHVVDGTSIGCKNLTFYVDGAHTKESLSACSAWFTSAAPSTTPKSLLFSCGSERNPSDLLPMLAGLGFREAVFCPMQSFRSSLAPVSRGDASKGDQPSAWQYEMASSWKQIAGENGEMSILSTNSLAEAIEAIQQGAVDGQRSVLVTGSLLFAGDLLKRMGKRFDEL
uniref:tetrahydrofolate synthase n=1 Tax=Palpitomonas bilix TaxID=652834 RepID=A0A7S3D2T1_9EUKA|mmetsp:Transcript_17813/g.44177  ORF Transcript_17813/g.44177 Transcript_17813/m.44177 type:complete len:498 (+) Transcript_17813:127-1620(+)